MVREIATHDFYCCLLPRCEALRTCSSGFPIATLVWNSHCTRVRFTVIVSCIDDLVDRSCPLHCLQRRVAKAASGLFCCWSLLRNNIMATNLQRFTLYYGSRRFVAWDCWTHTSWQVMQRDSDMLITLSHVSYIPILWKDAWVSL